MYIFLFCYVYGLLFTKNAFFQIYWPMICKISTLGTYSIQWKGPTTFRVLTDVFRKFSIY